MGPRDQPKGSVTTGPKEIDDFITTAYGQTYDGNVEDQEKLKEEYFKKYEPYIYNSVEAEAERRTGDDLEDTMRYAKETAACLGQWAPADLRMLSPKAHEALAMMLNEVEGGKAWPSQLQTARAAFLPNDEINSQCPLEHRVLLMLPAVYRMWATTRLRQLVPWAQEWQLDEMFGGIEGKGAADEA